MLDSKNEDNKHELRSDSGRRSFDDYKKGSENNFDNLVAMSFDLARSNDFSSLKALLDHGLNVDLSNHKGDSLLMLASYHGAKESVELLLSYGASVDLANNRNQTPLSGVIFKGYDEIARMLLKSGADVNAGIPSPIDCAIMFNRTELLDLMLDGKKLPLLRRILYSLRKIFSLKK